MASFYVGTWASRNAEVFPDPNAEYFTSVLYPIIFDDGLTAHASDILNGNIFENPSDMMAAETPAIISGNITPTIIYQSYADWPNESLQTNSPDIISGNITPTIIYQSYADWPIENIEAGSPSIQAGTITTVISYVDYSNWAIEQLQIGTPSIQSGEIT